MDDLTKALQIALEAHKGQKDLQGMPYILHVLRVMLKQTTLQLMIVAALHDVVEDSSLSIEWLSQVFSKEIIAAVESLTKGKEEDYEKYILRVKENPLAVQVKKSDLADNTDASRGTLSPERTEKYKKAILTLTA